MTTQTVSSAVEKRDTGPVTLMWGDRRKFAAVLPKSVDVDAFLGTMAGAIYASPELERAARTSPDSLFTALMRCAALGHMPGTDEFYLTPRKVGGKPSVLGIEGYRGIVERMYRSGAVAKVVVREVCARDKFRYVEGADEKPVHSVGGDIETGAGFFGADGSRDRGDMVGVYAYAQMTTGAVSRVVLLSKADVLAARDAGGYRADDKYSPWNRLDAGSDHPEFTGRSMWWKTAARRLEPWVPTSAEYRREMLRASAAAARIDPNPHDAPPAATGAPEGNGHAPAPDQVYDAEIVPDEQPERPVTAQEVSGEFARLGYRARDKAEVLRCAASLANRKLLGSIAELTPEQMAGVHARLAGCGTREELGELWALVEESRGPDPAAEAAAERALAAGEASDG